MGADQFLLTWNNHRSNFADVFSQLRVQDQLVDVTLLCDGGSFPAHRLVLAACSPYFHQLFTHLPTQHPIVYLRDVRQSELEALLEFIYKGEVSVANSELTGLIKIAESLRIKGLGDVSQRDPGPFNKAEKRSGSHFPTSSPTSYGRPKKAMRLATNPNNNDGDKKYPDQDNLSSIFSIASNYNLRTPSFPQSEDHNSRDSASPPPFKDSKLRSCLEGQDHPFGFPFPNLLGHPGSSHLVGGLFRREMETRDAIERKKPQKAKGKQSLHLDSLFSSESEKDDKPLFNDIKQENEVPESPLPVEQDPVLLATQFSKLYEPGDLGNSFLTKYTQLLSTFHQQQQLQQQPSQVNHLEREDDSPSFSSLIPTTIQEHQVPPSPKDAKSLTCHLCGATIKHIANFRRHMKQHLNPRRFPCPWCSAAFGRKDNLKTHTRKHHPMEVEAREQNACGSSLVGEGGSDLLPEERDGEPLDEGEDGIDEGQVYNGDNNSPINEDDDSADPNGEDDSLIIVDEGGEEEDEDEGERKAKKGIDEEEEMGEES